MSEKWTIEQLFQDEHSPNFFQRGPELMLLWECHDGKEAFLVWRGYDPYMLQEKINIAQSRPNPGVTYCVEFPSRQGPRSEKPMEKRKFDGGAKCLPSKENKLLITMIENKWGATLDEKEYMRTNGSSKTFYMKSDKTKQPVFTFSTWDEVKQMAFAIEDRKSVV